MKKLLFLGGLRSGGAEHQMVIVARLLKEKGYNVTYLTCDESVFFQHLLEEAGIPIIRIKKNAVTSFLRLNILRTAIILYMILRKNRYNTLISFLGDWNFLNCLLSIPKSTRHKTILGIRNNRDSVFLSLRSKFYRVFYVFADFQVSNSNTARIRYAKLLPKMASKLLTIYNAVELPQIVSTYTCKRDGKINIIVPASYREVKNPMRLLEAISLLSIEEKGMLRIDWYGSIKAGQNLYNQMADYIKDNQLEETLVLHDATSDIANRINEADIIGLFSTSEGLPNSICEGMVVGKPVIMTRVSDYNVLVDDSNGLLCDAQNPLSICHALSIASKLTESEIKSMGYQSKQKAQALFSKDVIIKQWEQII